MRIPFFSHWLEHRKMRDVSLSALVHSQTHLHVGVTAVAETVTTIAQHSALVEDELKELRASVAELLMLNRRRELMVAAAENLAERLDDPLLAGDISNHFRVMELSPLVELLRMTGRHGAAQLWADANDDWADFMSDDEPQDQEQGEPVCV
ncbi:hypothetical protein ACIQPR_43550 [Streptomyces sp. NPDC091280]|uniref:hypothetical protein n=1 Tax=Streptomyces sp. NPDC091280 TaxID=3365984 RepID=UPI00381E508F